MKYNKIILVSIILVILTMGAVSASDNSDISENITSPQDADILADGDDYIQYEDGTGSVTPDVSVEWPDELRAGSDVFIVLHVPEDMNSNVTLSINNERIDDGQIAVNNESYDFFVDEFGSNILLFKFYGDSKYKPVTLQKTYNVKDFKFDVEFDSVNVTYGRETSAEIDFPFDAMGTVTVNGVKYPISEDDVYLTIPIRNLKIGSNLFTITYSGDEKYPSKTVKYNVDCVPRIEYGQYMPFNNVTFSLMLPANAAGDLEVTVDSTITKTSKLKDGFGEVSFEGLGLGGHTFSARYTGNDYSCSDGGVFEIVPDITINSFKTTQDENTVEIRLPKGVSGVMEVKANRYSDIETDIVIDEITKSMNVTDGSIISLSTLYYGYYLFEIKFTSDDGFFFSLPPEGYIRDVISIVMTCPDTVMADDDGIEVIVVCPPQAYGDVALYVDGSAYDEAEFDGTNPVVFYIDDCLDIGTHNISARFLGNSRYAPVESSALVESTYLLLNIPEEIVIGVDDEITIETVKNASGNLVVYVDGKEFARKSITDGFASVSLATLPFSTHSVRAVYEKGNYPSVTKNSLLNVSYTFDMADDKTSYASDSLYVINVPDQLPVEDLVVKVDNVIYPVVKNGSDIGINISDLDLGAHVISVSHPGDDKFYPLSINKTIEVLPEIEVPEGMKLGEDESMTLVLPKNPQGRLVLSVFSELFNTFVDVISFGFKTIGNHSIAEIPLSHLGLGDHKIKIRYTGTDYVVPEQVKEVSVTLDLKYAKEVQYSKKSTVTITLPNAEGSIDVLIDDEFTDVVEFENGVAKIEFEDLEVGQHHFELQYFGDAAFDYEGTFVVYPIISAPTGTVIDGSKSIVINSGYEPVGTVTVYADGKKYKELDLDEGKQSISLGGLSNGVHKISLVYDSWDELQYVKNFTVTTKKASITAKDMSMNYLDGSKFKVQVKDYNGKPVKKGQSVKFYVDGKLYKTVKTDSKGYAYVVLTHAPKVHTVKVVYKATSISKKVTVKQIVTLKKVTVKKSAKKLLLTATLKKVKGKYLKNKLVTFKFNGKTYKAFTNSKGVAKITIPSKVLSKLKVGKNLSYQATYVKATVKVSVKIKK